jgi:sulfatase modifying factor 1
MRFLKKGIKFWNPYGPWYTPILVGLAFCSCSLVGTFKADQGEFKSTVRNSWDMEAPRGMALIPAGSFMMGAVDEDIFNRAMPNKRVTVSPFFMDDTEITNSVYRNFIEILTERVEALENLRKEDTPTTDEDSPQILDKWETMLSKEFIDDTLMPDPDVWKNDFSNHMADILLEGYHAHPAYDNYPVVGVSWEAARIFAAWRTKYLNEYREEKGLPPYPSFSLPSAAQCEYAARGGKELAKYPWGGPYIRDEKGKLRANFKSGRGTYEECGYAYTSPVNAFPPNDYGLYDMAGNVAEWTLDAYNPVSGARTWDLDPLYLDDDQPMKIIKGGSWKDISRFLQTGVVDFEHKDSVRSYIGFRCVMPYIGLKS